MINIICAMTPKWLGYSREYLMDVFAVGCLQLLSPACSRHASPPERGICFHADHSDKAERAEAQLRGVACSKAHDKSVAHLGMELGHFLF